MSQGKRRIQEDERIRQAADETVTRFTESGGESLRTHIPNKVERFAILHRTRQRRLGKFVTMLEDRGYAAIAYNGYTYMGDSASEVRNPVDVRITPMDVFEQSGDSAMQATETTTVVWARTRRDTEQEQHES